MNQASIRTDEAPRRATQHAVAIFATSPAPDFTAVAKLAARLTRTHSASIHLVDEARLWFNPPVGADIVAAENACNDAVLACALQHPELLIVEDVRADPRFNGQPLVVGTTQFHFYAGAPLQLSDGTVAGLLCVFDLRARKLATADAIALQQLAQQVTVQLELRRDLTKLAHSADSERSGLNASPRGGPADSKAPRTPEAHSLKHRLEPGFLHELAAVKQGLERHQRRAPDIAMTQAWELDLRNDLAALATRLGTAIAECRVIANRHPEFSLLFGESE